MAWTASIKLVGAVWWVVPRSCPGVRRSSTSSSASRSDSGVSAFWVGTVSLLIVMAAPEGCEELVESSDKAKSWFRFWRDVRGGGLGLRDSSASLALSRPRITSAARRLSWPEEELLGGAAGTVLCEAMEGWPLSPSSVVSG